MRIRRLPLLVAHCVLLTALAGCAEPIPASSTMPLGAEAPTPSFFRCQRSETSCLADKAPYPWSLAFARSSDNQAHEQRTDGASKNVTTRLQLDPASWARLTEVNRRVNGQGGTGGLGRAEINCQDYVAAKRQALLKLGIAPEVLSVAVAQTSSGEPHAVLIVTTDRGEFVLDNRTPWVTPWKAMDYTWLRRQSPGSGKWVSLASNTLGQLGPEGYQASGTAKRGALGLSVSAK